jgi:hypothetical protein
MIKLQNGTMIFDVAPSGTADDAISFTTAMTINNSGKVGIGTSSPSTALNIVSAANTEPLKIKSTTNGYNYITHQNAAGTDVAYTGLGGGAAVTTGAVTDYAIRATANLLFGAGSNTERMRIDSSGNLLVGTTNADIGGSVTGIALKNTGAILASTDGTSLGVQPLYADRRGTNNTGDILMLALGGFYKSSIGVLGTNNSTDDGGITFNTISGNATKTERMRITSSGNVGIGTSSPSTPLDVGGHIRVTGGNDCDIEFQSGSARRKFIGGDGNELELGTFSSSNTSRDVKMTIDSTGHTSISADKSGGYALGIVNDGNNSDRYGISIQCGSDSGSGTNYLMGFKDGDGNSVGSITFSGSSSSYNTSSDHRLKENVIADWDATTRLKQLNPVRFNFIAHADTTVDGFLAHEVQSVVPEAITGTHNEVDADGNPVYQGIDQSKLVPLLVKTIQELEARIVALETA